jgi:hypothetical protein
MAAKVNIPQDERFLSRFWVSSVLIQCKDRVDCSTDRHTPTGPGQAQLCLFLSTYLRYLEIHHLHQIRYRLNRIGDGMDNRILLYLLVCMQRPFLAMVGRYSNWKTYLSQRCRVFRGPCYFRLHYRSFYNCHAYADGKILRPTKTQSFRALS